MIYKCYNLPFDKSDISDTFYSNPQQVISDFKNGKNFDNEIMKQIIKRIEVFEDKQVQITFNF